MKGKRRSPEQVIAKLREAEALLAGAAAIGQICQKLAIVEQTFHRWRNLLRRHDSHPSTTRLCHPACDESRTAGILTAGRDFIHWSGRFFPRARSPLSGALAPPGAAATPSS